MMMMTMPIVISVVVVLLLLLPAAVAALGRATGRAAVAVAIFLRQLYQGSCNNNKGASQWQLRLGGAKGSVLDGIHNFSSSSGGIILRVRRKLPPLVTTSIAMRTLDDTIIDDGYCIKIHPIG